MTSAGPARTEPTGAQRPFDRQVITVVTGPAKAAMALMGLLEPVFRLPIVAPKPENLAKIRSALEGVGLIQQVYAAR